MISNNEHELARFGDYGLPAPICKGVKATGS